MSATIAFKAEARKKTGTGATRAIRRAGKVPAIIYGAKKETSYISIELNELLKEYNRRPLLSQLVELDVDGKKETVLLRELQVHPVSSQPEHIDFIRLTKGQKVRVFVHIRFINADKSPGLKRGGVLNMVRRDIELYCDPDKVPSSITVDLTGLSIGDSVHLDHINIPEGTESAIKRNFTIATVVGRVAKEEKATESAGEEGAEESAEGSSEEA